jgi:hypothetical protein
VALALAILKKLPGKGVANNITLALLELWMLALAVLLLYSKSTPMIVTMFGH